MPLSLVTLQRILQHWASTSVKYYFLRLLSSSANRSSLVEAFLYADDTTLLAGGATAGEIEGVALEDHVVEEHWFRKNKIHQLNTDKIQSTVCLGRSLVAKPTTQVKLLAVFIDSLTGDLTGKIILTKSGRTSSTSPGNLGQGLSAYFQQWPGNFNRLPDGLKYRTKGAMPGW